jgi:6-phosphogluconolactonase (cycloisomerase 2 family)
MQSRVSLRLASLALGAGAILSLGAGIGATGAANTIQAHAAGASGHVYVLDNPAGPNTISTYNRAADGALTFASTTSIGGAGTGSPLGSQGSLVLANGYLFAVDGGSNQISVVAVDNDALVPVGVYGSRGVAPVSVTVHGGLLYVVNNGDATTPANVTGFWIGAHGALTPNPHAGAALSAAQPGPAQVSISPDGATLAVTEKKTNIVDTFRIGFGGAIGSRISVSSTGQTPFGFSFNPQNPREIVVANAGAGAGTASAASYRVTQGGARPVSGAVADTQSAACWLIITDNGVYGYVTNAGSGTISGYRLEPGDGLALLTPGGVTATTGDGSHPLEMALTPHSQYLYALDAFTHTLSGFAIHSNGSLTPLNLSGINLGAGAVGLAAD